LRKDIWWTNRRHRQYWEKTQNEHTRTTGIIGTRLIMVKPETPAVLRQDTWWINQRHRQYCDKIHNGQTKDTGSTLVYSFCVLSQYCPCLCFVHFLSCLNTVCVTGLSIMCLLSILPVSGLSILGLVSKLPVSLVYLFCVLSQCFLWLVCPFCVLSQYCHGLIRGTCSIETRLRIDKPETQVVLRQDIWWTNQRHRQYWDKTQNGQTSHKKHWDKTQNR
jgi:hypothetical protein